MVTISSRFTVVVVLQYTQILNVVQLKLIKHFMDVKYFN